MNGELPGGRHHWRSEVDIEGGGWMVVGGGRRGGQMVDFDIKKKHGNVGR